MSDRSGARRAILSGLAVGAILGTPAAAAAAEPSTAESAAVTSTCPPPPPEVAGESRDAAATIRGQFEASFTAGSVHAPAAESTTIICAR